MVENVETSWFVLKTKPRWEKKVAETFAKKGIEFFLPLNANGKNLLDKKRNSGDPLFASYIFVRPTSKQMSIIKSVAGVINFMFWQNKPALISTEEINVIKDFMNSYSNVYIEKTIVRVGQPVKVSRGSMMHKEGNILQINNNGLKVELPSLGYTMIAHVSSVYNNSSVPIEPTILNIQNTPRLVNGRQAVNS